MPVRRALPRRQRTLNEMERIDNLLRRKDNNAAEACRAVNADRAAVPVSSRVALVSLSWAGQEKFTVVEDGDKKGFQSGKGIKAKVTARIISMTLPPRTPSWMPLDYAIWHSVVKKMMENAPEGTESKEDFINRLQHTAKTLPRGYIAKVIGRMKGNIKAVIDAKGYTPKND